ncbi:SDR family oxidoreductase [Dactylosporangium sp. NBC_01737]|uniref:SDR family NAD(P)-dependent oxidoreductase n=1 Tax=Dactylosporangium sp. NBC_01737 TaxID=2975959 RepID=UPI002E0E524D|nr:SDR family oxidoreductase [Dactylosporangium sp. NBC_01737]
MLLAGKNAIIYGGGGSVGGAMARAYGRAGARVFLAGRTLRALERVAADVRAAGGTADTAVVDALDERAVEEHAAAVVAAAGRIDVAVNVIADADVQGTPMLDMSVEDYLAPVVQSVRSKFITSRAAGRHMARDGGGGVLLFFGGSGEPPRDYHLGGLQTAFEAVEQMRRQLATELAAHGVRVLTLRTGGVPEGIPADLPGRAEIEAGITGQTLLGRAATLEDAGNLAVFAASDLARTMTGTALNMTCGAMLD